MFSNTEVEKKKNWSCLVTQNNVVKSHIFKDNALTLVTNRLLSLGFFFMYIFWENISFMGMQLERLEMTMDVILAEVRLWLLENP